MTHDRASHRSQAAARARSSPPPTRRRAPPACGPVERRSPTERPTTAVGRATTRAATATRRSTRRPNAFAQRDPDARPRASGARSRSATASSTTTGSPRRRRPTGRDGLGPLFNAQSCSSCHFRRTGAPTAEPDDDPERGLLLRLSVPGTGPTATSVPDPATAASSRTARSTACRPRARSRITTPRCPARSPTARRTRCSRRRYEIVDLGVRTARDRRA